MDELEKNQDEFDLEDILKEFSDEDPETPAAQPLDEPDAPEVTQDTVRLDAIAGMAKKQETGDATVRFQPVGEEEEIGIARDTLVFPFLYKLQEEVHRFTVSGMSAAKRKTLRTSSLEKVKGIGPTKAKALLQHFGTLANMRSASVSEIEGVKGVSRSEAESVYEFLHKTTDE